MMRRLFLITGCVVLALAWLGPLPARSAYSFTAHMTMHVLVIAVAAPLLAIAAAGSRADLSIRHAALFAPLPASLLELLVVWVWHVPLLHELARRMPLALALEQATFLGVGLLLWLSAFGGRTGDTSRTAPGIIGLLLTSMHMTLLGTLLALAPRSLYQHAIEMHRELTDQQLGGVIMLLGGGIAYLAGGLTLLARLLREPHAPRAGAVR